jgi:hypothetical protein
MPHDPKLDKGIIYILQTMLDLRTSIKGIYSGIKLKSEPFDHTG